MDRANDVQQIQGLGFVFLGDATDWRVLQRGGCRHKHTESVNVVNTNLRVISPVSPFPDRAHLHGPQLVVVAVDSQPMRQDYGGGHRVCAGVRRGRFLRLLQRVRFLWRRTQTVSAQHTEE
jgi:hypothetical protein